VALSAVSPPLSTRLLVVDVGTSGVRAAVVQGTGEILDVVHRRVLPSSPAPGFVELDPDELARAVLDVATEVVESAGPVAGVGIANQRATTIVWDRTSGEAVGPGIGWQDLRTVGTCLALRQEGIRLSPNASAPKLAMLLDAVDPNRERDLCFGTVDTWVAWTLSRGEMHVTDATNAGVTGMMSPDASGWSTSTLAALNIPEEVLPTVVDSAGVVGEATALPGSPPIAGIAGDQQASLVGQGCTRRGLAKATFGTGGMLDLCLGDRRPDFAFRGEQGTFPIVAWRRGGADAWGTEAVMLTAGTAVDWLVEDLGMIADAADSDELAARCTDTGDVWFVPALLGLGAPVWDFGARGTLIGLTRGTGRTEVVRAVLEGIAHRGADLVEAAETDAGLTIAALRVDGGMSANRTFVQALADTTQRAVEVSPVLEATTVGAAYLAGIALGVWKNEDEIADNWSPEMRVEPRRVTDRARWLEARARSQATVPELSALEF
jgi:glycerol kinase